MKIAYADRGIFDVINYDFYNEALMIIASSRSVDPQYPPQYAYLLKGAVSINVGDQGLRLHTKGPSSAIATHISLQKFALICPNDYEADRLQIFTGFTEDFIPANSMFPLIWEETDNFTLPKKTSSVYLRMKLKKLQDKNFDLISISDDKWIIVDNIEMVDTQYPTDDGGVYYATEIGSVAR